MIVGQPNEYCVRVTGHRPGAPAASSSSCQPGNLEERRMRINEVELAARKAAPTSQRAYHWPLSVCSLTTEVLVARAGRVAPSRTGPTPDEK